MISKTDILAYLTARKDYFLREYNVTKIGLFGSFSRGDSDANSDIDILLEFKSNTENLYQLKSDIKKELQLKFGRRIDLCREKYLKSYFKNQILESAIYV